MTTTKLIKANNRFFHSVGRLDSLNLKLALRMAPTKSKDKNKERGQSSGEQVRTSNRVAGIAPTPDDTIISAQSKKGSISTIPNTTRNIRFETH